MRRELTKRQRNTVVLLLAAMLGIVWAAFVFWGHR